MQAARDECVTLKGQLAHRALFLFSSTRSVACKLAQRFLAASCAKYGVYVAGPEAEECRRLIEAHKQCLRAEGFNVSQRLLCSSMIADEHCLSAAIYPHAEY